MKYGNDLGHDPISRLVLQLAFPSMIAQLVNVFYSIIDRMFIGNIPLVGDMALVGVGICGPIVTLLTSFGTLIGLGGSIYMAMKMGEGNNNEAQKILNNSFLLLTFFSISLTLLFLLTKQHLLYWFGASDITFSYANIYLTIYTCGTFFALLTIGLNYFITCQGFPKVAMFTVILGAATNIFLDYLFVFIFQFGVAGAAWATVIAQFFSCIYVLTFLFSKNVPIQIAFSGYSKRIVKKIISLGISPFLILATDSGIIILMNTILQKYGGPSEGDSLILCATITQSYMMLITGPMIGITGGTQAILSYNYGARNTIRVKQAEKTILGICIAFTTVMFFLTKWTGPFFVKIFSQEKATITLASWGIQVFTTAIIPLAFQYSFVDGLTALGCTKTALFLSLFRKSIFALCLIILPRLFTARIAFYAEPICDILSACLSTIIFLNIFYKHLSKRELDRN